jgi:hypothetical protein
VPLTRGPRGEGAMELSILIAKITAVVYLSAALGAIFSPDYYRRLIGDLFDNAALTYLTGFMAVVVGCLIVNFHNVWVKDWIILITILGWLALMKGVLFIAFPTFVQGYSRLFFEGRGLRVFPYVAVVMGLVFGYFGFVS